VYFGYCHVVSSSPDARNNGFTVDLAADVKWRLRGFHLLGTAGIMAQLYGGVEGVAWVRSYPVVYMTAGAGL